jgi:hypothetical protein
MPQPLWIERYSFEGDWNVTLAAQDRENHIEKRTELAQQINNSTLSTPHISGHTLISDEAGTSLCVFYVGALPMENGYWKRIEHRPLYHTDHL